MVDLPITDYVTRDLAALRGQLQQKYPMRKQRLYYFEVSTPRFGTGTDLACPWRYTVATEAYNEGDPVPSRVVKIGSAQGNPGGMNLAAIQVAHTHATKKHAVIEFVNGNTLTVIDLGNEPGTRLNGARISKCRMVENDVLRLGSDITSDHTTIRYVGCEDITLGFGDNPHPFVERCPYPLPPIQQANPLAPAKVGSVVTHVPGTATKPICEIPNPFTQPLFRAAPTTEKPIMKKPRSHDRKPLQFNHAPSRERAPITITYPQLYHAIRLAAQVGEATAQTRKPAMDALSAFLIGLNVSPGDFLPKEDQS